MATKDPAAPYGDPTLAQVKYHPKRVLPMTNNDAVAAAPGQITFQGRSRSGTKRKIKANTAASVQKVIAKFADSMTHTGTGSTFPRKCPARVAAVVASIDDVRTPPAASTRAIEKARCVIMPRIPVPRGVTSHIVLRQPRSSEKTAEAP